MRNKSKNEGNVYGLYVGIHVAVMALIWYIIVYMKYSPVVFLAMPIIWMLGSFAIMERFSSKGRNKEKKVIDVYQYMSIGGLVIAMVSAMKQGENIVVYVTISVLIIIIILAIYKREIKNNKEDNNNERE